MAYEIREQDGKIILKSAYHPELPERLRQLGGRWNPESKTWSFQGHKEKIEEIVASIFGKNDEDRKTVRIQFNKIKDCQEFWVGEKCIRRPERDCRVMISEGAAVISGGFPRSGGSRNHPRLEPQANTVVEFSNVPLSIAENLKQKYPDAVQIL